MSRSDRIIVAAAAGALVLAIAAAVVLLMPTAGSTADDAGFLAVSPAPSGSPAPSVASPPSAIVVDVAGAVTRPGLVELPGGARIGEAIAAAGGYAPDADLGAAAAINLARVLADGEQVRVPRIGENPAVAASTPATAAGGGGANAGGGGGGGGGLVDLNTATPEQLEALPGIGAVTVQKIVAARQERPFTSLDDAVQRGVIHRGQLEDIRELATAG
jgi:competence protein ComEA